MTIEQAKQRIANYEKRSIEAAAKMRKFWKQADVDRCLEASLKWHCKAEELAQQYGLN